jgi:hypothetical protein
VFNFNFLFLHHICKIKQKLGKNTMRFNLKFVVTNNSMSSMTRLMNFLCYVEGRYPRVLWGNFLKKRIVPRSGHFAFQNTSIFAFRGGIPLDEVPFTYTKIFIRCFTFVVKSIRREKKKTWLILGPLF